MMITDAKMQVIMEAFKFEILKSKVNLDLLDQKFSKT
jgi:hypothetical protein